MALTLSIVFVVQQQGAWLELAAAALTASAAATAWLQTGRYQEQQQSYALAAHELGLIVTLERYVTTEEDFARFVADSESAISREHTTWLARRGGERPGRACGSG